MAETLIQLKKVIYRITTATLFFIIACSGTPDTSRDWENFAWEQEYFTGIREPLHLAGDTPHGFLAVQHIRFMSENLYGRKPFSYREKEAAVWLVEELLAMGHSWENIQVQEFPVDTRERWWGLNNDPRWASDFPLRQTQLSQNVILTVPGRSERTIIAGAHYDSYPVPGATDNASGTSLLLESAQRILYMDNYYTIMYIFFGAEETGLIGSAYFAGSLTSEQSNNIVLMINADNLFDGPHLFYGAAVETNGKPDANDLTRRIDTIAQELDLGLISHPDIAFLYSDQLPFLMRGYTVVSFGGLFRTEYLLVPGFFILDDYMYMRTVSHTRTDCFHRIEDTWPGMIETIMRTFSIFLEKLLMMDSF